jgi:tetraacyldisaccharide 4'-kinase
LSVLSASYGRLARLRRFWYERHPQAQRALDRPVISVGNLSVGGSGKTPVVAALARLLVTMGHRPAILSRGYARRRNVDGVVVVSDGERVLEPVEHSGDEPQMLARALPGVPVLVCPERHLAGRLAERQLGCTVLLLDDGFQHLVLGREVDLLIMPASDLDDAVLPSGRLREPLDSASAADGILVPGSDEDVERVAGAFDRMPVFRVSNHYEPLQHTPGASEDALPHRRGGSLDPPGQSIADQPGARVVAVAGIARPARFFNALRAQGYEVVRELAFPDHHWYTTNDLERVTEAVRATGADLVVTTAKDAVRLPRQTAWAVLPMTATIEPPDRFAAWLEERL